MIRREEVSAIAYLAKLDLSEAEMRAMLDDLRRILGFVKVLGTLDVPDGPDAAPQGGRGATFREDAADAFPADDLLALSPLLRGRLYEVPRIIGEEPSDDG